jgi:hypothetical protein
MSNSYASGSIPSSEVVAYQLAGYIAKFDRKLVAELYAMDALWHAQQGKKKEDRVIKFPLSLSGVSPIRHLVNGAASKEATPAETAAHGQKLFKEFVALNSEAIGFDQEIKFTPRDMSSARVPLGLLLELERQAHPKRMFEEHPRMPADIVEVILNGGRGAVDEEVNRPGAEFSMLLSKLCPLSSGSGVLDMSCGTGTLLAKLLTDKESIHAFGQETEGELAIIAWLRLQLHPAAASAYVRAGDPLKYSFALNAERRPIDVALVHSLEMDADEEQAAAIRQQLREAEEAEQRASWYRVEFQHRLDKAQHSRENEMVRFEATEKTARENPGFNLADFRMEREEVMRYIDDQLRNLQQQRESREQEFYEAQRALKSIQEQARKPDVGRTYELIKEALATVNESGMVIAVVLARNLFKSPQVDRIRSQAVEHGRLNLVVELPRGVDGADERVAVLVFRKGRKKDEPILFVDATDHEAINRVARPSVSEPVFGYRRARSAVLTTEFFTAVSKICLDRLAVPGVAALVPNSVFTEVDGRQVDLRPRQFLISDRLEEPAADHKARLAQCHQAVVSAEAALIKARAQLGLPPLFTPTSSSKPSRQPGN